MNDEAVLDRIGEALCRVPRVWTGDFGPYEIADALLPVVREIAAEELREAAASGDLVGLNPGTRDWLRVRADALANPEAPTGV